MILPPLRTSIVWVAVLASVALPLTLHRQEQSEWRAQRESLRQQADEVARWTAENEGLSNSVAHGKAAQPLAPAQLAELLRLRSEVGQLRRQLDLISELQAENRRLRTASSAAPDLATRISTAELDAALSAETLEAGQSIARELAGALQRFAQEHTNAVPTDFAKLRRYFPTGSSRIPGLSLFEFVRDAGPAPADALILRECGSRSAPDGKERRVYVLADGNVVESTVENGDFDEWERQHGIRPRAPER